MRPSIVPSIRSIPVACRHQLGRAGLTKLPLELKHPSGQQLRAVIAFRLHQTRGQSTSNGSEARQKPAPIRRATLREIVFMTLHSLRTLSFRNMRLVYRRDPWVVISAGIVYGTNSPGIHTVRC